jgi:preprotein translocase subunit YajC
MQKKSKRITEDDEVKILEGLKAYVVAVHDDEVIVETEDGRPKWIKLSQLKLSADLSRNVWTEVADAA